MSQRKDPDNMWDGSEQYKEELERLHAPAELTALIKEKAAAEEAKQRRKRIHRKIYLPVAAAAAFAVIVLSFPLWRNMPETKQTPVQPYLGSAADPAENEEGIILQQTMVLPLEFLQENVWIEEIEGVQVKFVQEDGVCTAAFAGETGYTVASRKTEDVEAFREEVRFLLQNGGNIDENRK